MDRVRLHKCDASYTLETVYRHKQLVKRAVLKQLVALDSSPPEVPVERRMALAIAGAVIDSIKIRFAVSVTSTVASKSFFDNIYVLDGSGECHRRLNEFIAVLYTPIAASNGGADEMAGIKRRRRQTEKQIVKQCVDSLFEQCTNVPVLSTGTLASEQNKLPIYRRDATSSPIVQHNLNVLVDFRALELFCAYYAYFYERGNSWKTNILDLKKTTEEIRAAVDKQTTIDDIFDVSSMPWMNKKKEQPPPSSSAAQSNVHEGGVYSFGRDYDESDTTGYVDPPINNDGGDGELESDDDETDDDDDDDGDKMFCAAGQHYCVNDDMDEISKIARLLTVRRTEGANRAKVTTDRLTEMVESMSLLLFEKASVTIQTMVSSAEIIRFTGQVSSRQFDATAREKSIFEFVGPVGLVVAGETTPYTTMGRGDMAGVVGRHMTSGLVPDTETVPNLDQTRALVAPHHHRIASFQ